MAQPKVPKLREYFVYFPISVLHGWGKRPAIQPQTNCSEVPKIHLRSCIMKYPMEKLLPYSLLALFVLAVFYGIYFAKMLAQKRRGIQTRQIGKRKEKSIPASPSFLRNL